jgi:hypothetical protein
MGRIKITMDVYDESADESDSTGVTNAVYDEFMAVLMSHGDDVNIERAE